MAGIPGELLAHGFVDFSTTRNWALRVRKAFADLFQLLGAWQQNTLRLHAS